MNMKKISWTVVSTAVLLAGSLVPQAGIKEKEVTAASNEAVINEVAWMGTTTSYNDEWVELYNASYSSLNFDGWVLEAQDGSPSIPLSGTVAANDYFLLERTSDDSVPGIAADQVYTGVLGNSNEVLYLKDASGTVVDEVDSWYAGDNTTKATMERMDASAAGTSASSWSTATAAYVGGYGTPKAANSGSTPPSGGGSESLTNVSEDLGAINVFFNKSADTQYASAGNEANYNVNLEDQLIERLNTATTSIDLATYEINLPRVIDTLMEKAAQGVDVRILADAKDATDPHYTERYETMRLYLEKLVRGKDAVVGTADDAHILSDSPMFVVEDAAKRSGYNLPASFTDFEQRTVMVGSTEMTGHLFVEGEEKSADSYYSPGNQMHNKFAVVDDQWVFTGSWNFTVTGLYGTEENMNQGILDGNQQHVVEIHSPELASIYETEFEEMWGSSTTTPDNTVSNFSTRKIDNTPHSVTIGGREVEVYFSSGDDAVGRMTDLVRTEADESAYFTIFAWSDQALVDELKNKWEGSYTDNQGTLTGFDVKGLFDPSFWNQWWSASIEMTGRTASQTSTNNPNTRWANPAPVYQANESRKLHAKTMIIDADTSSDPTVIVGSTNWSENGNNVNDENMLIIHDAAVTNQFLQEFNARYVNAGGVVQ
ncbi:phospholipase D-like domain-containing protein [Rossellomorea aquimaris]|uniref:phospholipase D-like domain-containing protein n=1 Tax=Rossellomorea aquimaris TaxID=189382 RepID=UPI001CD31F61|nr:phospholipase D-like domain-containing protein [Rossellomorea aquimaris]MCA1056006.1 phospholipase D-like domain-containing protein [Rossellomorea aquimaris]